MEYSEYLNVNVVGMPSGCPSVDEINSGKLAEKRKIYLDTDVDENLLAIQRQILLWNMEDNGKEISEREPVWLYVFSYGGELDYMWMLIDTINASETPVYTVNIGTCASAASLIFISGKKRFMMENSKMIVHEGSAAMSGDSTKVLDASDSYRKAIRKMKEYIVSKTNVPIQVLNKKRNNDWEIDSVFALENGMCDVVVKKMSEIV